MADNVAAFDVNEINDYGNRRKTINTGGRPSKQYLLTPLCFEFMVARQCKSVFEIYHKIFHAAVSPVAPASPVVPQMVSYLDMFDMMSKVMRDQEARMLKVESSQKLLEERVNEALPRDSYITVMGFCSKYKLRMTTEAKRLLGVDASRLCKQRNLMIDRVPDKRYGSVSAYPEDVLCELCESA